METDLRAYVVKRLKEMPRADWEGVASASQVPLSTLHKVVYEYVKNPRSQTIQKLAETLAHPFRGRAA